MSPTEKKLHACDVAHTVNGPAERWLSSTRSLACRTEKRPSPLKSQRKHGRPTCRYEEEDQDEGSDEEVDEVNPMSCKLHVVLRSASAFKDIGRCTPSSTLHKTSTKHHGCCI